MCYEAPVREAPPAPRVREWLVRATLVVASVAGMAAAGEVAVRIHRQNGHKFDAVRAAAESFVGPVPPSIMDVIRPNSDMVFANVRYRFDSRMIRGAEHADYAPPGVFRIVITGDSVTMGHGVAEDETYSALLERALNEAAGRRAYEVVNLGISNLNAPAAIDRLSRVGMALHPDLIVYGATINDIEGTRYYDDFAELATAYQAHYYRFRHSPSFLMRALWPRIVELETLLFRPPGSYMWILEQNYFHNPPAWNVVDASLARLAELGTLHGVCAHLLVHAHLYSINFLHPLTRIYDKLGAAGVAHGLTVTQSYPYFRGRNEDDLIVSVFDRHPNANGHAIMFQALYDGLRQLPPSCWSVHDRRR